jgi:hypothetical protein
MVSVQDFFARTQDVYFQAEKASGGVLERYYHIGGFITRLQFAGPALIDLLTPALEHLSISFRPGSVDLSICLWDSKSTQTPMLSPTWSEDDYLPRGKIKGVADQGFSVSYNPGTNILSMLDRRSNIALYWVRSTDHLPVAERGAPLLSILSWWMASHGRPVVHAGAVGTDAGGVLLAGKGGAGKSATALNCLKAGFSYLSDDYCAVSVDPEPRVYSLYNSGKLDRDGLSRLSLLENSTAENIYTDNQEKRLFFLSRIFPERIVETLPLRAVLLPVIIDRSHTALGPITPVAAMKALAPSTVLQISGFEAMSFALMGKLVRRLPCFALDLGSDMDEIPGVIGEFLERHYL